MSSEGVASALWRNPMRSATVGRPSGTNLNKRQTGFLPTRGRHRRCAQSHARPNRWAQLALGRLGDLAGHLTPEEQWGVDAALLTVLGLD